MSRVAKVDEPLPRGLKRPRRRAAGKVRRVSFKRCEGMADEVALLAEELQRWAMNVAHRLSNGDVYRGQLARQHGNLMRDFRRLQAVMAKLPTAQEMKAARERAKGRL